MDTVCLHCGDIGFPETLVFCNGCQACTLHRYCLDGPVIKIDDVTWFCEDCEPKQVVAVSPDQSTSLSSETSDSVSFAENAIQTRELKNCTKGVQKRNQQQQMPIKEKQAKRKVKSGSVSKTKDLLSDSVSPPQLEYTQCSNSCEEESMLKNECEPVPRDAANSNGASKSFQTPREAYNDHSIGAVVGQVVAQPIVDPIWRGTLNFCNETIGTVGLVAHTSTLACSKVYDESIRFPKVLHADLVPRYMVWPNHFKNAGPTDKSIALYFFPESERDENVFDKLVNDLIHRELAIKVVAQNAELLIFPSTLLLMHTWGFQSKHYLWGVFRGKQSSQMANGAVSREGGGVDKP
ncbi:putative chromatin regulator PHD family [Lupinus albus]|uniref:Putative chromatin regulator PHD family n=1 Tax=Lupinus albus TaxID=3870 RepID=A0A6A4QC23_LUPAL|nr:putative chromatin regulator PHD family [Lupinus albus]